MKRHTDKVQRMGDLPNNSDGWRRLLAKIARITRKPTQAEDFMHSAYIKLEEYRLRSEVLNPTAFLLRTAVNLSIDQTRHGGTRNEIGIGIPEYCNLKDPYPLQDEILMQQRQLLKINERIERLPRRTRQVFVLHRLEGMKYREIAATLGISESAVEKHISKALIQLESSMRRA